MGTIADCQSRPVFHAPLPASAVGRNGGRVAGSPKNPCTCDPAFYVRMMRTCGARNCGADDSQSLSWPRAGAARRHAANTREYVESLSLEDLIIPVSAGRQVRNREQTVYE